MTDVKPLQNGYIVVEAGKIKEVGSGNGYLKYQDANFYSLAGKTVVPGFIDSHTHLVFAGSRENEMRRKLQGESYLEILKSGGGILSTVRKTREASFDTLYKEARTTLERMLSFGVTSVEAKSGYGLDLETELKQLEVVAKLKAEGPQTLVSTFMGAHALPGEYHDNRQAYFALLEKALYEIKKRNLASFVDIFCEEGVFSVSESREFLGLAKELGFKLKIHADEMSALRNLLQAIQLLCYYL
jgi:imidazolonepropionase